MLLSYKGKTTVSSSQLQITKSTITDGDFEVTELPEKTNADGSILSEVLTDENPKSFWVADANDAKQWVQIEFPRPGDVYALQLNFHDHESGIYTRVEGLKHRFIIEASEDGKTWKTVIDRAKSYKDTPNAYLVLNQPVKAKYIRYKNIEVPGNNLALSEIRVFGKGYGKTPAKVKAFNVARQPDRRDAQLTWDAVKNAQGYNIRWGIAPNKLYQAWLVYDAHELFMRCLDRDQTYYFSIEAFNENGISQQTQVLQVN